MQRIKFPDKKKTKTSDMTRRANLSWSNIPKKPGVYLMKNKDDKVIYVGKAKILRDRISWYTQPSSLLEDKTKRMVSQIYHVETIETVSELDAILLETVLIKKYKPKYNVIWRDDKHPLYIKITCEEFPRILTARKEDDNKSLYFGPFPSSKFVRQLLRTLRKVFPYCTQKRVGRRCFYNHIGLCNPCPSEIVRLSGKKRALSKKEYRRSIANIRNVLSGKTDYVVFELEKQMKKYSVADRFEEAALIRDRIIGIKKLHQMRFATRQYLSNPNLAEDIRKKEMIQFTSFLKKITRGKHLPFDLSKQFSRLECFDISTISGKHTVGSMVVFIDGEAQNNEYRRFFIKEANKPDDAAMIACVIRRRLKHSEWLYPDIIVVDGGKSQVASALRACADSKVSIPVVGLAKRFENVILPFNQQKYSVHRLPEGSLVRFFLQRVRDEAHRFAIQYHHKRRRMALTN